MLRAGSKKQTNIYNIFRLVSVCFVAFEVVCEIIDSIALLFASFFLNRFKITKFLRSIQIVLLCSKSRCFDQLRFQLVIFNNVYSAIVDFECESYVYECL